MNSGLLVVASLIFSIPLADGQIFLPPPNMFSKEQPLMMTLRSREEKELKASYEDINWNEFSVHLLEYEEVVLNSMI